ncbi:RagB/SusD family nutrient uptake outer membrane protein [Niabella ginsengisoli]|uniref:RagB/SusD family nutrient uptake outer membrane protein n=1 Tax=Niabella ginsengisoli TaxID=522298 RepID=A0ABS9SE67_9BACT|nr:RagB/SusD family nutrient uptake outer membrane protein [Niabella ginsengisoli]MCH5596479.1 RagB/SusD family nutrient uptake outer membrane protein [Niabella ginsengisoli]
MMKNIFYKSLIGSAVLICSCAKNIEKIPLELTTIDYIFDSADSLGVNAERYLSGIYNTLPKGYNRVGPDLLDAASDDAVSSGTGSSDVFKLATGGYNSSTLPAPENMWGICYAGIRKANIFINNIDRVPLNKIVVPGFPKKHAYKAEARFVRSLLYFELIKRYGGVPITGDNVWVLGDDVKIPRNSFKQCVDYIVSECDAIEDSLRTITQTKATGEYHSITRGAGMALKSRVLLYAASPLFNGGNIESGNDKTGYTDVDNNRWKLAADAAKELIDRNEYDLVPTLFSDIFITVDGVNGKTNKEVILARLDSRSTAIEVNNGPVGFSPGTANGITSPTQELVDAFPMKNGLNINDPASGYDIGNPYTNRDPRLDMTILYNGHQWLNTSLETFEGGRSHPGNLNVETKTGYYMRKFMGPFEAQNNFSDQFHDFILFRYAEVLLNFAEARNEFSGPDNDVYQVLINLRKRAGIEEGADGMYGVSAGMSKEEMRQAIRNERRIELAFEEHRYWDLRRWKIAETAVNTALHGMSIIKGSSGRLSYTVSEVFTPMFATRQYLYPIPYDEVVKNPNMVQNPGW